MNEVKTLTIVCSGQGIKQYTVGYMGIEKIVDESIYYPESAHIIYVGYGKNNKKIFSAINVPIEIEYFSELDKDLV